LKWVEGSVDSLKAERKDLPAEETLLHFGLQYGWKEGRGGVEVSQCRPQFREIPSCALRSGWVKRLIG
jgi:hypothetical protein